MAQRVSGVATLRVASYSPYADFDSRKHMYKVRGKIVQDYDVNNELQVEAPFSIMLVGSLDNNLLNKTLRRGVNDVVYPHPMVFRTGQVIHYRAPGLFRAVDKHFDEMYRSLDDEHDVSVTVDTIKITSIIGNPVPRLRQLERGEKSGWDSEWLSKK